MIEGICYGDCFDRKTGVRIPAGRSHIHIGDDIKLVDVPEPKPLAQYLALYLEAEIPTELSAWCELLEQALDAYESTENVKIKIERI